MKRIVIDCDPGLDDAIAILLACASPEFDILGITTVAGNVPMERVQRNARQICELAGRLDIPVYAGCPRPLLRPLETAKYVHGESGLGGVHLPEPQRPLQPQHGVDFLVETLMAAAEPLTLATLGPLTNVAIALVKEPRIRPKIQELVLMGGSLDHGNTTPAAEFNIYVDPHAAHIVFTSGIPLTMIGLHVTHTVLTTGDRLDRIRALGNQAGQAAADMLAFYGQFDRGQGMVGGPLHDPCVIAYLLQPELFSGQEFNVQVELHSPMALGQTLVDRLQTGSRPAHAAPANVNVIMNANADGFYELLIERLGTLP